MEKAIITVVGKDQVGIIANICTFLAKQGINILDISQTIIQDYFNMMMIVDVTKKSESLGEISDEMNILGQKLGVDIKLQHVDIFQKMHRL